MLAISKTVPVPLIREIAAYGQRRFGESYVQEALPKITDLHDLRLEWHFVGPLQSNKTRAVANHFDWVHSVSTAKVARRLHEQRPPDLPPLNICLQVNISHEASKSGADAADLLALAQLVTGLEHLKLRGLMAIPEPDADPIGQRERFRAVHDLYQMLQAAGFALDTLSMGMSGDLEAAIAEGSTLVRIGTALFGERS